MSLLDSLSVVLPRHPWAELGQSVAKVCSSVKGKDHGQFHLAGR